MADRPEITLPPRKMLGIDLGPRYEVEESSAAAVARPIGGRRAEYGFVDTVDAEISRRRAKEVGYGIRDAWVDPRDTTKEVALTTLEGVNTRGRQTQIYQRVEILVDDSHYHYETARLLDQEALVSREAWGRSMEVSYMARSEIMTLSSIVMSQQTMISQLQAADHRSQIVTSEMLQGHVTTLQGQVTTLQGQQGPSGGPAQPVAPEEAGTRDANRAGDDSHTSGTGVRRTGRVARGCTYQDFMKCQPLNFKGIKGVVQLTQWFERMETVFRISPARNEMKKLEAELWNLEVQGTDMTRYNQRFQELALLCVRMFPEESDKVERYVGGWPDMIHGSVVASKRKTMQEATEMATEIMDKKIRTLAEKQAANKRKFEDTSRNNQNQQQPSKRQNVARAYAAASGDRKPYCPKLKNNNNLGNQVGTRNAQAKVYAVGNAGTNSDANVVTGMFLLNNRYASVLFYTGADRSFVSTAFSSQIDIAPTVLDHDYAIELADGRIIGVNTIIRSCTLNFLNHPFNIYLMPVEMHSFDVIIGMDWLSKYQAVIVCADKIVRIPWGRETLIFHGN
ncbi:putative reverse transcriptase domain-containing protein, partial [Tanacetum coccineum]